MRAQATPEAVRLVQEQGDSCTCGRRDRAAATARSHVHAYWDGCAYVV
ncbi:MAG TPA: hypothetical protein VK613_03365 [Gaiellaceae bacterium]|nr:hypothetical protein [Gaiellaceae bacterium]